MVRKLLDTKGSDLLEPSQNMNLSLLIGPDRFTCLVYNNKKIISLTIFEWHNEPDLLKTLLSNLEAENITVNKIESINLSILTLEEKADYKLQSDKIQQYFKSNFPAVQIKDCFGCMLHAFKNICPKKSVVFSYWQSGKIYFWALTYGAVDKHMSSPFRTAEDALYCILQFYKLNNFSTTKDSLYLSGALSKDSAIYALLHTYIAEIEFVKRPTELQLNTEEEFHEHLFFDILSTIS